MRSKPGTILWALFALFVVYGGTIPFRFTTNHAAVAWKLSRLSLNPLISDTGRRVSVPDVVQNVLLFVPFGALGVLAGAARSSKTQIAFVTGVAAIFAVGIEALQLLAPGRVSSFSDVVADTAGALLGAIIAARLRQPSRNALRRGVAAGTIDGPNIFPMLVSAALVSLAAWSPFDVTINVSDVAAKLHALQRDPWQFQELNHAGMALVQYALLALTTSAWIRSLGLRHVLPLTLTTGALIILVLEASEIAITSRIPGLCEALVCAAGLVSGAVCCWARPDRVARAWWLTAIAVTTIVGAAMSILEPFNAASFYQTSHSFLGYRAPGRYLQSFALVRHAIDTALVYIPLGFCLSWLEFIRKHLVRSPIVIVLLIAVPLEVVSSVGDRGASAMNVGLAVAGGLLGAWAGSRGASAFNRSVEALR